MCSTEPEPDTICSIIWWNTKKEHNALTVAISITICSIIWWNTKKEHNALTVAISTTHSDEGTLDKEFFLLFLLDTQTFSGASPYSGVYTCTDILDCHLQNVDLETWRVLSKISALLLNSGLITKWNFPNIPSFVVHRRHYWWGPDENLDGYLR